jgi:hypothetical protein
MRNERRFPLSDSRVEQSIRACEWNEVPHEFNSRIVRKQLNDLGGDHSSRDPFESGGLDCPWIVTSRFRELLSPEGYGPTTPIPAVMRALMEYELEPSSTGCRPSVTRVFRDGRDALCFEERFHVPPPERELQVTSASSLPVPNEIGERVKSAALRSIRVRMRMRCGSVTVAAA